MSELESGQGPKDWPNYREQRTEFVDALADICDALGSIAMADGAKKADATNAVVHELMFYACILACDNAKKNLGRDPRLEQWTAVTTDIFHHTLKAIVKTDEIFGVIA